MDFRDYAEMEILTKVGKNGRSRIMSLNELESRKYCVSFIIS